jgi:uncharacterized protein (DUF2249 family)
MSNDTVFDLDVRTLAPRDRHTTIFAKLAELAGGQHLGLINDHDPKPLYYQLQAEQPDQFTWTPEETGPERWVIRIARTSA